MNFDNSIVIVLVSIVCVLLSLSLKATNEKQKALENRITVLQLAYNDLKKNQDILIEKELTTIIPFETEKEKKK